jgi:hypothetical protein
VEGPPSFYVVVQFAPPGRAVYNLGVLLYDARRRQLLMRFRQDYDFASSEDVEILAGLAEDLTLKAAEHPDPLRLIEYLEDTLSNAILITPRVPVPPECEPDNLVGIVYAECIEQA